MDLKKMCGMLYMLFFLGAVVQVSVWGMIVGCIALLVAVVILYKKRAAAAGTAYESHFTWLVRTFWIGGIYLAVLSVAATAVLYMNVDLTDMMNKISSGELADPEQMQTVLMTQYGMLFRLVSLGCMLPFMVWWVWRCWKGYDALKNNKPVDNVNSWL